MEEQKKRTIAVSNDFIHSNLTGTPAQSKLTLDLIGAIRKDDEDFEILEFDLRNELNSNSSTEIDKFVQKLRSKQFKLKQDDDDLWIPLFGLIKRRSKTNILQARLSEEVKPFLLGLRTHFTQYKESDALQTISGTYSFKLFQLLSCESMGGRRTEWIVSVKDFRWKMGLDDTKYPRMTNFSERVLEPAIKGNAEVFHDLTVEKLKRGRSIHALRFRWKPKPKQGMGKKVSTNIRRQEASPVEANKPAYRGKHGD